MNDQTNHSRRRYVRFAWATLSGWGARVVSILTTFIVVPLTAGYLGVGRYGVWMTVSSVIGWLGVADLGMGDRLTTKLAHATGTNEREVARRETTTVFWTVLAVSAALLLIAFAALPFISWTAVFGAQGLVAEKELTALVAAVLLLVIATLPLSLVWNIFDAHQEGWKLNAYTAGGSALSLLALMIAVKLKAGLPLLGVAMLGPQVLVMGIASVVLFGRERPYLLGGWRLVNRSAMLNAAKSGGWYFLVGLQSLFWVSKDNLLISHLLGPESVGPYSTGFRVYFSLLGLLGGRIGQSLWPAYAEAMGSGHHEWIRSAFRRTTLATLGIYILAAVVFTIFAAPLIRLWAGKALVTSAPVLWSLAAEFTTLCWVNLVGYLLMAANRPKVIAITGLIGGFVSIPLGVLLSRTMGLAGVPIANTVCLFVFVVIPLGRVASGVLSTNSGKDAPLAEMPLPTGGAI